MINAAAPYRRDDRQAMRVPVVMPLVEVTVDKKGYLTVTLDREPYSPESALRRDDLKWVLDDIAADLGTPVRVEVREVDTSTFIDIVTPDGTKLRAGQPFQPVRPVQQASVTVGEVAGQGFLPNEEVAVAVVVAHQLACTDGTARLRLPPALLETYPGLVVLMGQKSGTVMVSGGAA